MSDFRKRLLRRSLLVVAVLGAMGYAFGQVFLMFTGFYSPTGDNPANQRVLWQTPLVMAGFGLVLTMVMEALAYAFRKRMKAVPVAPQPTTEELLLQILAAEKKG